LRWLTRGVRGPDGSRVYLQGVRVGGRWVTSVEALARFSAALSALPDSDAAPPIRTPHQRRAAAERAGRALDRIGI
jgi:hypothetical protein